MVELLMGSAGFLLFYLYELHGVTGRFPLLRFGFGAGCLLLLISTIGLTMDGLSRTASSPARLIAFGFAALLFLGLLFYTLFFALPFSSTYLHPEGKPRVCRTGVYALCRHPGVLWFIGLYLSLWLGLGTDRALGAFLLFSLLNMGYVLLQDGWSFPAQFQDYHDYKKVVPFLIPSLHSIRRCFATLHG